jgi:hypothetical protein
MFEDLLARCDKCQKTVPVRPKLMVEAELKRALADPKAEVWVRELVPSNHAWKLNEQDKKNWLGRIELGIPS